MKNRFSWIFPAPVSFPEVQIRNETENRVVKMWSKWVKSINYQKELVSMLHKGGSIRGLVKYWQHTMCNFEIEKLIFRNGNTLLLECSGEFQQRWTDQAMTATQIESITGWHEPGLYQCGQVTNLDPHTFHTFSSLLSIPPQISAWYRFTSSLWSFGIKPCDPRGDFEQQDKRFLGV